MMVLAMSLNIGALAGDIFVNSALSAVVDIVAKLLVFVLVGIKVVGRRRTIIGSLCSAGIVSLLRIAMIEFGRVKYLMIIIVRIAMIEFGKIKYWMINILLYVIKILYVPCNVWSVLAIWIIN